MEGERQLWIRSATTVYMQIIVEVKRKKIVLYMHRHV